VAYSAIVHLNQGSFDNVISHNGLSGLSFDGGSFEVKNNKIFENWLWGLMIKSKSSTYLLNNDIFENKCGGIRVGIYIAFLHLQHDFKLLKDSWQKQQVLMTFTKFLGC
jgi:parallel beta-helix repeat protein